jgi:hypothetical protein
MWKYISYALFYVHIFICSTHLSSSDLNTFQEIWIYYITLIEESFPSLSPIKNGTFFYEYIYISYVFFAMFNNIIINIYIYLYNNIK